MVNNVRFRECSAPSLDVGAILSETTYFNNKSHTKIYFVLFCCTHRCLTIREELRTQQMSFWIVVLLVVCNASAQLIGAIEPNNSGIYGWACYSQISVPVSLSVYAGTQLLGTAMTGAYSRPDAAAGCGGYAATGFVLDWWRIPVNQNYDQIPNINSISVVETSTGTPIAAPLTYELSVCVFDCRRRSPSSHICSLSLSLSLFLFFFFFFCFVQLEYSRYF
jgi:hypothetical protein